MWLSDSLSFRGIRRSTAKADEPEIQGQTRGRAVGFGFRLLRSLSSVRASRGPVGSAGMTARIVAIIGVAGLTAGCFQPMYGSYAVTGSPSIVPKMKAVEVLPIDAPNGTRLSRVGGVVRDDLIFALAGGEAAPSSTYRLNVKLTSNQTQVIIDINTARPDINYYGIDATYTLLEIATGKMVVQGQTFSRVSYNIPNEQQRFVGERGLRDAEDRAAKVIAENIRNRLASYFVAGT